MACGCGKKSTYVNKRTNLNWTIAIAKKVSKLREIDVQIFKGDSIYEIEFPLNPNRKNVIKIIKYEE